MATFIELTETCARYRSAEMPSNFHMDAKTGELSLLEKSKGRMSWGNLRTQIRETSEMDLGAENLLRLYNATVLLVDNYDPKICLICRIVYKALEFLIGCCGWISPLKKSEDANDQLLRDIRSKVALSKKIPEADNGLPKTVALDDDSPKTSDSSPSASVIPLSVPTSAPALSPASPPPQPSLTTSHPTLKRTDPGAVPVVVTGPASPTGAAFAGNQKATIRVDHDLPMKLSRMHNFLREQSNFVQTFLDKEKNVQVIFEDVDRAQTAFQTGLLPFVIYPEASGDAFRIRRQLPPNKYLEGTITQTNFESDLDVFMKRKV